MFYFYRYNNNVLFSVEKQTEFEMISTEEARQSDSLFFFLGKLDPKESRRIFAVSDPFLLFIKEESPEILKKSDKPFAVEEWLIDKIKSSKVYYINTACCDWKTLLKKQFPKKWRISIIALGDLGSVMLMGLRMLGEDCIGTIGIYERNEKNAQRWEYEINQVYAPFKYNDTPEVKIISEDELTDCDMLIFCAAKGYAAQDAGKDIRMAQFESNSEIISGFARMARKARFNGIFAVVSDPVDLLCRRVFLESNKDEDGFFDCKGLAPEQIRGFGLGVMNARAVYLAKKDSRFSHYLSEGRAFGPHGKDLIIADSIENYNDALSIEMTNFAVGANLMVRELGYKPYVAPALSSAAYSVIAAIKGSWHYSATSIGGVFFGAKNRLRQNGAIELETLDIPEKLYQRISESYKNLKEIL